MSYLSKLLEIKRTQPDLHGARIVKARVLAKINMEALRERLHRKAHAALLIGAAAEKIAAQIEGATKVIRAETLECAVAEATKNARPGDTVLLAPACASFDQFQSYEHRGRVFKELVNGLRKTNGTAA